MAINQEQGGGSGVSIRPTEAVQMGLIDNFDGEITDAKWMKFNYNGKSSVDVLSLAVEIDPDDGEKFIQQYSCGQAALKNYVILTGNTKIKPVNPAVTGLPEGSNVVKFLSSLVTAQGGPARFDESMLSADGDVTCIVGVRAHFLRVANATPTGVTKKADDRENTILLVNAVLALPGSKPAGTTSKAPGAPRGRKSGQAAGAPTNGQATQQQPMPQSTVQAPVTAATNGATTDINAKAQGVVLAILASRGGTISKQDLAQAVFADYGTDPDRNKLIGIVSKDDFLKGDQPWGYDGGMLSLG